MIARGITTVGALLLAAATPLSAQADDNTITASVVEHADGHRTLIHEAIIDAPVARVWEAFTTVDGWKSWGVQFAEMDVREGGLIETGYFADATAGDPRNIKHRILVMIPERLMVTRIEQAPEGGPVDPAIFDRMWSVYRLEELGENRTRLTISGHGYAPGERFDRVLNFFEQGNVIAIEQMRGAMGAAPSKPEDGEE